MTCWTSNITRHALLETASSFWWKQAPDHRCQEEPKHCQNVVNSQANGPEVLKTAIVKMTLKKQE